MNMIYMALLPSNDGRYIRIAKDELLTYFNAKIFKILKENVDSDLGPVEITTEEEIIKEMNREEPEDKWIQSKVITKTPTKIN